MRHTVPTCLAPIQTVLDMKRLIIFSLCLLAFMKSIYAEPCANCPSGSIDLNQVVKNISTALQDPASNVLIVRKRSDADVVEMIRNGTIPHDFVDKQTMGGKFIQVFEVLQGLDQREVPNQVIMFSDLQRGRPHPETGTPVFSPPDGTEWLMLLKVNPLSKENQSVQIGELFDFSNSVFARSAENRINTNTEVLLQDLKRIQSAKSGNADSLELRTGIAKLVAESILRNSLGKE